MNVAKNWALIIMLTALAFAHFSSKLLLKEQMIIPVKKTLNNAGHIDAKLIYFSEIGWFFREFWLFSRENPTKSGDFSANLPLKILRNFAFFSAKYQKPCKNRRGLLEKAKTNWSLLKLIDFRKIFIITCNIPYWNVEVKRSIVRLRKRWSRLWPYFLYTCNTVKFRK